MWHSDGEVLHKSKFAPDIKLPEVPARAKSTAARSRVDRNRFRTVPYRQVARQWFGGNNILVGRSIAADVAALARKGVDGGSGRNCRACGGTVGGSLLLAAGHQSDRGDQRDGGRHFTLEPLAADRRHRDRDRTDGPGADPQSDVRSHRIGLFAASSLYGRRLARIARRPSRSSSRMPNWPSTSRGRSRSCAKRSKPVAARRCGCAR